MQGRDFDRCTLVSSDVLPADAGSSLGRGLSCLLST